MQRILRNQDLILTIDIFTGLTLVFLATVALLDIFIFSDVLPLKTLGFLSLLFWIVCVWQYSRIQAKRIRHLSALYQATLESTGDGILVTNNQGKIIDFNQKLMHIFEIEADNILSKTLLNDLTLKFDSLISEQFSNDIQRLKCSPEIISTVLYCKNGLILRYQSYPQRIRGRIIGRVYSFHDVTHGTLAEQQLLYFATHDSLTGLSNRLHFMEHIKNVLNQAKSQNHLAAILFFDLNRFKIVNDSLGHETGDGLLKAIANRLLNHTRKQDLLARLGGDEFVLAVSHLASEEEAITITQRYLTTLSKPFQIEEHSLYVQCSIGISIYPEHGTSASILLKNADIAMYEAKKNQLSWKVFSQNIEQKFLAQLTLENGLFRAVEKQEFILHYQPIINLRTQTISAMEALIRWQHPTQGLILPNKFIGIIEDIGLSTDILHWTLDVVCNQIREWQQQNLFNGRISINLSSKQCLSPKFYEKILEKLKAGQLNANYLELELTEKILTDNFSSMADALYELQKLGVSISLDDFGTGYSNLKNLKHLPLNKIKIDQSFIKHLPESDTDKAIVTKMIQLAKDLNINILAEGVENQAQLNFLCEQGCDEIQGFYFSKPLFATDFAKQCQEIHSKIKPCV